MQAQEYVVKNLPHARLDTSPDTRRYSWPGEAASVEVDADWTEVPTGAHERRLLHREDGSELRYDRGQWTLLIPR